VSTVIHPLLIGTLSDSLEQGLRNGMDFVQLRNRIPAHVAKQLKLTEQDFHAQLQELAPAGNDYMLELIAQLVASKFTPAEQAAIAKRKFR
jgi:hypothetical protein